MEPLSTDRRRLLLTLGAAGVATLAGCSSGTDETNTATAAATDESTTTEATTTGEPPRTLTATPGNASVGMSASKTGTSGAQSLSIPVGNSLDGQTLNKITVGYDGAFDLSGVEDETVDVYVGGNLEQARTAMVTDVTVDESGTSLTLAFGSSVTFSDGETIIVEYDGVKLPERSGEYLVSANINDEYADSGAVTVEDDIARKRSTFEGETADGWRIAGDAQGGSSLPNHVTDDGTPEPCISAVDDVQGGTWYFVAPAKFHVKTAEFYGGTLTYDIYQNNRSSQFSNDDVKLSGGGTTLAYDFGGTWSHPQTDWTSYAVALDTSADWRIDAIDGDAATRADIETVLGDVTDLQIRGEYVSGSDTGYLDNPTLWPPGGEPPSRRAPTTTTATATER